MADDKNRGLYNKYTVERNDGRSIGEFGYLVLEFSDPNAWPAIEQWANTVFEDGYEELSIDVIERLSLAKAAWDAEHVPTDDGDTDAGS